MPEKIGRIIGLVFALPVAVVIGLFKIKRTKYKCCHNPNIANSLKDNGETVIYCTGCGVIHGRFIDKAGL